tara:strand:+ start:3597 stop:3788 length:192 start_codon:yes stop_codon:yes gene_type:complete
MIIPIRCFSCGKPVGHLYEDFLEKKKKDGAKKALDSLKVKRFCCRACLMGHVDLIDTIAEFKR